MKYLTFSHLRSKLGGRARSSIYLDVEAERLPAPIKLGGRLYWREDEVDEWLRLATVDAKKRSEDRAAVSREGKRYGGDHRHAEAADKQGPAPDIARRRIGERPPLTANTGSRRAHRILSGEEGTE
jgi:predicted DNA-binding transcriptional regulator AlpA